MRHALVAAALLVAPAAVMAEGFSYTYLDARYYSTDSDAITVNQNGGVLTGSLALTPVLYVVGSGSYGQSEDATVNGVTGSFDALAGSARLGAHHAITETLDVFGNAGVLYQELKGNGGFNGKEDDVGYLGQVGLRLAVVPQVELTAFYGYQDIFDESNGGFTAELQYHATENWSAITSANSSSSTDIYTFGVRYRF